MEIRFACTDYLFLMSAPAQPQMSTDKAEVAAARGARTCSVEIMDQLKCGGRPQKATCSRPSVVGTGHLREEALCLPCWQADLVFKWRGFPNQAPIVIDAQNGKLIECRP